MDASLKKLKIVDLKQILRDNGLRVGGTKPDLIARILENNIIYENDIKITPVYIQKGMTTNQTVPQLKALLKSYGLKVSGKKAELIERLNAYSGDVSVGKTKISRKEIKPYEKMLVADLKQILKKLKLSLKGKKADLVDRLYDYDRKRELSEMENMGMEDVQSYKMEFTERYRKEREKEEAEREKEREADRKREQEMHDEIKKMSIAEMQAKLRQLKLEQERDRLYQQERENQYREMEMMGMEDVPDNEALIVADAYIPMPSEDEYTQAIPLDTLFPVGHYSGQYLGRKYDPNEVSNVLRREYMASDDYIPRRTVRIQRTQLQFDQLLNVLPPDSVKRTLQSTNKNMISFVSQFNRDAYLLNDVIVEMQSTKLYDMPGWKYQIVEGGTWGLNYYRIITPDVIKEYIRYYDSAILAKLKSAGKSMLAVQFVFDDLRGGVYENNIEEIFTGIDGWNIGMLVYSNRGVCAISFKRDVQLSNIKNAERYIMNRTITKDTDLSRDDKGSIILGYGKSIMDRFI